MRRLFVTGTDTGVGKTTIACALAAAYRRRGFRVATLKPIETGCVESALGLVPEDAIRLARAAGEPLPPARSLEDLCPQRFALPASPQVAAAASGRVVDLEAVERAAAARGPADILLIEGAGGLLVPLAPGVLQADLMVRLGAPVLVVARAALGTVNHTLLTLEAARRRGLVVAGVILDRTDRPPGPEDASNAPAIAEHGGVAVLGTFPWRPGSPSVPDSPDMPPPEVLDTGGPVASEHLDLDALWLAL